MFFCVTVVFNPLNATGANMHQIHMLIENYGIERVKLFHTLMAAGMNDFRK